MGKKQYWNIVKGLGIIAVVVGHSGSPITAYVYMYHLALFFFVSGVLYKDKYSEDPFAYFASRMRRLWWPMVQYGIVFTFLHNAFLRINIYSEQILPGILPTKHFHKLDFLYSIKGTLFMQGLEPMGGAMWFLYPLLVGMIMFCSVRYIATKFSGWKREILASCLVLAIYLIGIAIIKKRIGIEYHTDIAMLVIPIIYIGFLVGRVWDKFPIRWYLGLVSLIAIVLIYKTTGTHIELSQKQIIGPKWFLLASFSGIYFNLFLAKILQKSQKLSILIAYLGENSFHIMALHFLMFKIVNWLYVLVYSKPYFWIAKFPIAYSKWWIIYTVVGILGSVLCVEIFSYLKSRYKNHINKEMTI